MKIGSLFSGYGGLEMGVQSVIGGEVAWHVEFDAAIRHWERTLGRLAPTPTAPTGRNGEPRHTAEFVEWMMGLPAGWVIEPSMWEDLAPEEARKAQLTILGNGVVPQHAALATSVLLSGELAA